MMIAPHFRAADLETADRDAALSAKGITLRALVIGSAFVMAIAWLTPYVEEYLNGTLIASNHLPVSALLALLIVALMMNLGLMLHRLPWVARVVYIGGYVLSYWGFWLWYQYERARLLVPDIKEGLPWSSWTMAALGFAAGLTFLVGGAMEQEKEGDTAPRNALGAVSALCLGAMAVVLAVVHLDAIGQVEVVCGIIFLLVSAWAVVMTVLGGPLDRPESLVVLAMTMVMAAIPNIGLMGYLLPVMTAPYFYASPENGWAERLHQHIPNWLSPKDNPEAGFKPVEWLYDGLPDGQAIPWGAWVKPLFFWSIFTLLIYGIMFFVSAILRKQWSDKERLPFPLAQVPLAMTEDYKPGQALAPFFRDRLVWIGIAIPFIIHSYNSLHDFLPSVPQIPLHFTNIDGKYLTEPPWTAIRPVRIRIYLSVIGITYLISREVAFSLWFFYLLQKVMVFVAVQAGYGTSGWDYEGGGGWHSMLVNQGFGAMIAMVLLGAYMARGHLWEVTRKALGPMWPGKGGKEAAEIDDSVEPVSYAVAFWGFWVCLLGAGAWLFAAGMSVGVIAALMIMFVLTIIGLTRLVAEGGLFYVQSAATCPQEMLEAAVGTAPLGAKNLTIGGFLHGIYMFDLRSMVMPSIMHSFKIAGEGGLKRRHMALAVAIALVLGLLVSYISFLDISYKEGGNRLSSWFYRQWPVAPFREAANNIKRDMSKLTSSSRTVIAETRMLLEEKPWAVEDAERSRIEAAIGDLEVVLKDVETTSAVRSRLTTLKESLRTISQRTGLGRLKDATRILENAEERTDRNLYALRRAANFLSTVDYPPDKLTGHLADIESILAEWKGTEYRSDALLYRLEEDLKELADSLAEISALVPHRDASPLAEQVRSLAGAETMDDETYGKLKTSVNQLVERWNLDRGIEVVGIKVNSALAAHEDAVDLAKLREMALLTLVAANTLYANSGFVAARPVVADTPGGRRLIVPSGDGTVFGLDPETGEVIFRRRAGDPALIEPPLVDVDENQTPEVLIVGRRGTLVLLDTNRGRLVWSKPMEESLTAAFGPVAWKGQRCMLVGTEKGRVLATALKGGKRVEEFAAAADTAITALGVRDDTIYAGHSGGFVVLKSGDEKPAPRTLEAARIEGPDWSAEYPKALFPLDVNRILVVTRSGYVMLYGRGGRPRSLELGVEVRQAFMSGGKCLVVHKDGVLMVDPEQCTLEKSDVYDKAELMSAAADSETSILLVDKQGRVLRWTPQGIQTIVESNIVPASPPALVKTAEGENVLIADESGGLYAVEPKGNTAWRFSTPGREKSKPYWYAQDWARWFWTGVGGAVFWGFTTIRQRIMWWPHPIGYVFMMSSHATRKLWFSIMMGWMLKALILKYLGFKKYYRLRGFFIGIVVGEVMAGGLWIFIDFITSTQQGWPIHIN